MAATDLQISENSFLVEYFDMPNAKLHLVWGHFQHGNPAMPFKPLIVRGCVVPYSTKIMRLTKFSVSDE